MGLSEWATMIYLFPVYIPSDTLISCDPCLSPDWCKWHCYWLYCLIWRRMEADGFPFWVSIPFSGSSLRSFSFLVLVPHVPENGLHPGLAPNFEQFRAVSTQKIAVFFQCRCSQHQLVCHSTVWKESTMEKTLDCNGSAQKSVENFNFRRTITLHWKSM